jgi:hypothetical protein
MPVAFLPISANDLSYAHYFRIHFTGLVLASPLPVAIQTRFDHAGLGDVVLRMVCLREVVF